MNFLELIRGSGSVLLIMIVAGGIAYVGDRVGHQVGRRRLTLFGIRPRHTSTIVAIGTGMLIAFSVTMAALLASQQVRTAFFRLSQINEQIAELKTQQQELEAKVNTGELIVPVGALLVPFFDVIKQGEPVDQRLTQIKKFYGQSVVYMNQAWGSRGLRRYVTPGDINKTLTQQFGGPAMTDASLSGNLLMFVNAPQNLYKNDEIHFDINVIADSARTNKGAVIASLMIPGSAHANPVLAVNELQQYVASVARTQLKLPSFLSDNVQIVQVYPSLAAMQKMLSGSGENYVMTAFAAEDIYPHTGGVPIVIALTQSK
jgi:hypothetical protein